MNSNLMALCCEKVKKALNQVSGGLCYFTAEAKHAQLLDVQKTLSEVVDALASPDAAAARVALEAEPVGEGPSREQILSLANDCLGFVLSPEEEEDIIELVRAILDRWGRPAAPQVGDLGVGRGRAQQTYCQSSPQTSKQPWRCSTAAHGVKESKTGGTRPAPFSPAGPAPPPRQRRKPVATRQAGQGPRLRDELGVAMAGLPKNAIIEALLAGTLHDAVCIDWSLVQ